MSVTKSHLKLPKAKKKNRFKKKKIEEKYNKRLLQRFIGRFTYLIYISDARQLCFLNKLINLSSAK